MTKEEMEELKGLAASMGLYDDKNPCKRAVILGKAIEALEQESKTGHWYIDERPESDRKVICSNCEQPIFKYHKMDFDYRPKYCPNCGARMDDPQESNDKCKNCEYYRNPDYTRCHECKAESEDV